MKLFHYDIHGHALFENDKVMLLDSTSRLATVIKLNPRTVKIKIDEDGEVKNISENKLKLQEYSEKLNRYINK
jgi:hypothetical protein